jgi:hypothetical protein
MKDMYVRVFSAFCLLSVSAMTTIIHMNIS